MTLHWLSFCDRDRPKGSQFLGVVILQSPSFLGAVMLSHVLGINPGGECAGIIISDDDPQPPPEFTGRLLNKDDIEKLERRWQQ